MKNNIAILYSGSKVWGGIDTYLLNYFKNYDKNKIGLFFISLGDWEVVEKIKAIKGESLVLPGQRLNIKNIFRIRKYLKNNDINLFVSGGLVADSYARVACLFSKVPHLSIIHSEFKYDYPNIIRRTIYKTIVFLTRFETTKYIAVSSYLQSLQIKSGIPKKKVSVIYSGVEPLSITKKHNTNIVVGSIGRLHKVKNYLNLIKAAQLLQDKDITVRIWGEGHERGVLQAYIDENNISNVKLEGHINNIENALSEVDIYIQPSLSEGFGLTVVEAMMAGLPVIVSPKGSLPEIVENNISGFVMNGVSAQDIADAIRKVAYDKQLWNKIATTGQKSARQRFNIKKWSENLTNVFLEAAK